MQIECFVWFTGIESLHDCFAEFKQTETHYVSKHVYVFKQLGS